VPSATQFELPADLSQLLAPPSAYHQLLPTPAAAVSPVEADEEALAHDEQAPPPAPATEHLPEPVPQEAPPPVAPEPQPTIAPVSVLKGAEELDLWWGAYSGWALAPSFTVCVLATTAIIWASYRFLPSQYLHFTILGLAGAVWIVQLTRWVYRVFGYNYRLTNRRLYVDHGWLYSEAHRVDLTEVKAIKVRVGWWEKIIQVGDIVVTLAAGPQQDRVLEAVAVPQRIARQIEHAIGLAREAQQMAGK
jgi:membrane protein YdbS with pleckstrin-like domain